jgi:hypothetical protein
VSYPELRSIQNLGAVHTTLVVGGSANQGSSTFRVAKFFLRTKRNQQPGLFSDFSDLAASNWTILLESKLLLLHMHLRENRYDGCVSNFLTNGIHDNKYHHDKREDHRHIAAIQQSFTPNNRSFDHVTWQ